MKTNTNSTEPQNFSDLFSYGLADMEGIFSYSDLMTQLKQPSFRAGQLAQWLWVPKQGSRAKSYEDMNNLPLDLRAQLAEVAPLFRGEVTCIQRSKDGTRKYLIQLADGSNVEAVGLPALEAGSQRLSVCVSSQAGCAMGCSFCATGQSGLVRSLSPGEIAEQVRIVSEDFGRRASSVVVMGQGEPFANYDASLAGLRILNASEGEGGFGIGARHITLSTAGIIKGIERLSQEPEQFTLAISLHSAIQKTRDKLMPGLKTQTLDKLEAVLIDYYEATHRRPSLEYALIHKVNTTPEEIVALLNFARKTKAHVNLIPLNPTQPYLKAADNVEAMHTAKVLRAEGIQTTLRKKRGSDINAACGQLAQKAHPCD